MREPAFADAAGAAPARGDPASADRRRGRAPGRGRARRRCIVFDVPLLVESGRWRSRVDRVLVVDCTRGDADRAGDARAPAGRARRCARVIAQQASASRAPRRRRRGDPQRRHRPRCARSRRSTRSGDTLAMRADRTRTRPGNAVKQSPRARCRVPATLASIACVAAALILYEYPFNESIRTMLRLEHLFDRLGQLIARDAPVDHHYALATIFEIMDVGSRADLKSDLLQGTREAQASSSTATAATRRSPRARSTRWSAASTHAFDAPQPACRARPAPR